MTVRAAQPLRRQIRNVNLAVIVLTIVLALGSTLALTLRWERRSMNEKLLNSARMLTQFPEVTDALRAGAGNEKLWDTLDRSTAAIGDIDVIVVADTQGKQLYYPDRSYIGLPYAGKDQQRILEGEGQYVSDDTGVSGAERCAYAEVRDEDGTLLGFVMVGIYVRSYLSLAVQTAARYLLIAAVVTALGILLSHKLSDRIKGSLMGYEPGTFLEMFHQREDILEALEEGILAIDSGQNIMYINRAAAKMIGIDPATVIGRPLHEVYPASTLDRVMETGKAEYNISMQSLRHVCILSDRMPIRDGDKIAGAVAIFRNRTEVTRLAEDLTGVRHMVEAMRAYTHEFMNKLHVILGLIQIGEPDKAAAYIMDITGLQRQAVDLITERIEDPATAALLVGKTSRCAELGIRLRLDGRSHLSREKNFLPQEAYVTILGNLIENATESLNQSPHGLKEITVSIREEDDALFLCVEDTGPGISPQAKALLFEQGFTTKGPGRGTGLTLVREVAAAYHGEIRVESEPGVGTAFFLTFRRQTA